MNDSINYIKDQRASGVADEHIAVALSKAGHTQEQIKGYFSALTSVDSIAATASYAYADKKFYTEVQIMLGVLFLVYPAFYMRYKNYQSINEVFKARLTLVGGFVSLLLVLISRQYFNDVLDLIVYAGIVVTVLFIIQQKLAKRHKDHGGLYHSYGQFFKTILMVVVIPYVIFLIVYFGVMPEIDKRSVSDVSEDAPSAAVESVPQPDTAAVTVPENWITHTIDELGVQFSYPAQYGEVVVSYDLGAPPEYESASDECRQGGAYQGTLACTGAVVSFGTGTSTKPFMYFHGKYMTTAPQGGWWGLLQFPEGELPQPWAENPVLLGEPNTKLYATEMGGDTDVQFARYESEYVSHVVIGSPIEVSTVTAETRQGYKEHVERIPPAPPYRSDPEWSDEYSAYVRDVQMYDVSGDPAVREYLQMLRSISFGPVNSP